jgi:hypothetical protein
LIWAFGTLIWVAGSFGTHTGIFGVISTDTTSPVFRFVWKADSEISRTLPAFSNRNLLSKVAHLLKVNFSAATLASNSGVVSIRREDMSFSLWSGWYSIHSEACRLGRTQSRLEMKLLSIASTPRVELRLSGKDLPLVASTDDEIDRLLARDDNRVARSSAKAQLTARRNVWDEADAKIGFSAAKQAEEAAMTLNEEAASRLLGSQALSMAGAIGKLHALISVGQPSAETDEFPWPQLRLLLLDMIRMANSCSRQEG